MHHLPDPPRYVLFNDGTHTDHDHPETNLIRIQRLELDHHKQLLAKRFNHH